MANNIRQQAAYVSTGDPETVDDLTPHAPGMVGVRVTVKQPGPNKAVGAEDGRDKTYQYVQGDSTMTVAPFPGAVAWWADKTKYRVTTSPTTLGRGRIAGVIQGAPAKGNFFYIQTQGPGTVKFVDAPTAAPTAAGGFVIPSATAGKADCLAAGSAATYPTLGTSASAANGNAEAIVDLDVQETP